MSNGAPTHQSGIREHLAVDSRLQEEINHALEDLADSLPGSSGMKLAAALKETLDPSWAEHVSFQEQVLFPIILSRHANARDVGPIVDRLKRDHMEVTERHAEVSEKLDNHLNGRFSNAESLGYLLRSTFELRGRHWEAEQRLDALLPRMFTPADMTLFSGWTSTRSRIRFVSSFMRLRH
jgi:hypothetical protein